MRRGDIVDVELLLVPGSRVQGGRRPAIAILAEPAINLNPLVTIIPLTRNLGTRRFRHTIEIEPSPANGLTDLSIALVFQITSIDRPNIVKTRGHLEDRYLTILDAMLREMLGM